MRTTSGASTRHRATASSPRRKGRDELDTGLSPEQQRERLGEHLAVVDHEDAQRPAISLIHRRSIAIT